MSRRNGAWEAKHSVAATVITKDIICVGFFGFGTREKLIVTTRKRGRRRDDVR